jgi:hypothetical protein
MMDPVLLTSMVKLSVLVMVNGQDVIVQVSINTVWPFYTYLHHIHVLDHGHFTYIVSALAI